MSSTATLKALMPSQTTAFRAFSLESRSSFFSPVHQLTGWSTGLPTSILLSSPAVSFLWFLTCGMRFLGGDISFFSFAASLAILSRTFCSALRSRPSFFSLTLSRASSLFFSSEALAFFDSRKVFLSLSASVLERTTISSSLSVSSVLLSLFQIG